MIVRALDRKLLRDLVHLRGQVITIALVIASGITSYVATHGTWRSLSGSRDSYYARNGFADVFAHVERAPNAVAARIAALPGVADTDTRLVEPITLPLEGMDRAAAGLVISLPREGAPGMNRVHLVEGRLPDPNRADEAVILHSFAEAHGLRPGQRVPVVMERSLRRVRVVGIGMSPEHVFAVPAGGMTADPGRFSVLWMGRAAVERAYGMEGAFDDVSIRLQPGASEGAVLDALDALLDPYGTLGAYGRSNQLSNRIVEGELAQLRSYTTIVPTIFLAVAAFLVNVVLSRLVHLQRPEIAALRALGYSGSRVGLHYLELVAVVSLLGVAIGIGGGLALGRAFMGLYQEVFAFPMLAFHLDASVLATAILVSLAAASIGAGLAVRAVIRLPPAEAMRPPAPSSYHRGIWARLGLGTWLGTSGAMVAREIARRPLRLLVSSLGIAFAIGILVTGRFMVDALDTFETLFFETGMLEDATVTFLRPVSPRTVRSLRHLPAVTRVEASRAVPVRIRGAQRFRDTVLFARPPESSLRRVVEYPRRVVQVGDGGLTLCRKLGEILGVGVGDPVWVEVRGRDDPPERMLVAALIDEPAGIFVHGSEELAARLLREDRAYDQVYLTWDPSRSDETLRALRALPGVASVETRRAVIDRFRAQTGRTMGATTVILTLLAATIAVGIVYNNARVALSVRARDFASLRVLGFTRGEVSAVLIGELVIQMALAVPLGLFIGAGLVAAVMSTTDPETFRFPGGVSIRTYAFAVVITLIAGVASALAVRRRVDRLDLIGVLKTRE